MAEKPLPTNEADWLLLMQNISTKLPAYSFTLGITPGEVTTQANDTLNFQYVITFASQLDDSVDAFYQFKTQLIKGDIATAPSTIPTFPAVTMPEDPIAGIEKRIRLLIKRIKSSTGYTEQIGEDLGLIENSPNNVIPGDVVPTLSLKALSNSRIEIGFSKKGFDAMRIDFQQKNEVGWQFGGVFTSSPGIHELAPIVAGEPENREYRGILMEKNVPVTQFSATYNIVTMP